MDLRLLVPLLAIILLARCESPPGNATADSGAIKKEDNVTSAPTTSTNICTVCSCAGSVAVQTPSFSSIEGASQRSITITRRSISYELRAFTLDSCTERLKYLKAEIFENSELDTDLKIIFCWTIKIYIIM
jgi:hypothetical protein